jgi:uncharacterized membrane protein (UPF0127 family)
VRTPGPHPPQRRAVSARPAARRAICAAARALLLCAVLALAQACGDAATVAIVSPEGSTRARLKVEVAATNEQRAIGLMFRRSLAPDAGMLFVFKTPGRPSFWMKNTRIPLDMVFAGPAGRIVGIVANAEPFSETSLNVAGESQFVLEVNGGFCRQHGIRPGDMLKFEGFSPRAKD